MPPARVLYSVAFLTLFVVILSQAQPALLFRQDGSVVPFGVGPGKTLFTLGTVTVAASALSLFAFALVDVVYQRSFPRVLADFA